MLAFHIKDDAASGGNQYFASLWTVYNKLMGDNPDVLATLAEDWEWPGRRVGFTPFVPSP
jgi:Taurine catabolism dioxygenase TauD, TfdA family